MRALFLLPLLVPIMALGACQATDSLTRIGQDGFEVGPAGIEAFGYDNQACTSAANEPLSYDIRLMDATRYARNRAFNRVYARCMTGRGHRPRPYIKNLLPEIGGL